MTKSLPPEDPRDALIRELTGQVSELTALVAELREQLDAAMRAASRNSGNSSLPPSGDDQPGRQPRKERRAAERAEKKRSRGKQPGSAGAAMRAREPDETLDHFPEGACGCGLDLAGAADLGVARSYQQEDVPEPQPSRRYQHDLHKTRCACGKVHVAPRPDGVPDAPLSARPAAVSGGGLPVGFPARARRAGATADRRPDRRGRVRRVRATVPGQGRRPGQGPRGAGPRPDRRLAGGRVRRRRRGPAGREKKYVHGAFTELYSAFHLGTRSIESMKKGGILPFFAGIVVSDRYQGYWSETWTAFAGHQACAAHLIRDFEDCAETYPGSGWPQQAQGALRGLIHAWHTAREQGLPAVPDETRLPLELEFRRAVTFGLACVPRVPGPRTTVNRSRAGRYSSSAGPAKPTCSASPRHLRLAHQQPQRARRPPPKTQQKISGRLTSDDVTQDRLDIRGYIDTARKHGFGALEVLEQLMRGNPWMPPAQPISP